MLLSNKLQKRTRFLLELQYDKNGGCIVHNDPSNLIVAISRAMNRKLNKNRFDDRLLMQKGCYILNSWGFGPKYRYSLYIRGPYSSELADDYFEMTSPGKVTDVPEEAIHHLSEIMTKGIEFTEAYATVLLIKNNNPGKSNNDIFNRALEIKPHLKKEIVEVCPSILN